MHLADTFIQSDLQCIQAIHFFCQYMTKMLSMLKKVVLPTIFENSDCSGIWWIESSKEQHLFEIENFCNIINVFTVTFNL